MAPKPPTNYIKSPTINLTEPFKKKATTALLLEPLIKITHCMLVTGLTGIPATATTTSLLLRPIFFYPKGE